MGNFLLYVSEQYDGVILGRQGRIHHFVLSFKESILVDTGPDSLKGAMQAFLFPHPLAVTALWILLLIETGANTEVCRNAVLNGVDKINDREVRIVLSRKMRAGGRPIVDVFPVNSFVCEAIARFKKMSQFMRDTARFEDIDAHDELLVHWSTRKRGVVSLTESNSRAFFKRILDQSVHLSDLNILPNQIRSSVLIKIQNENDGALSIAQVMADHANPATTDVYTGRSPIRIMYTLKIQEFQRRYQAIVIASIDDGAEKLGLSSKEFKRILSDAFRTGLGVACLDPKAGIQPGSRVGEYCTKIENCPNCKMRWVVATENNIVDLILFNRYLKSSEAEVYSRAPDRWEKFWLPWLVFTETAIDKVQTGSTASVYQRALVVAGEKCDENWRFPLI